MGRDDRVVTLSVASRDASSDRAPAAFGGERLGHFISFAPVDQLWQILTRERWDLIQAVSGHPPRTVEDLATDVDRPPAQVRADAEALCLAGVIDREGERVSFPFDVVHVDFTLRAAV